ncbi:MAG: CHASE2 domain-containing protein, partial [Cyanobacteriota bacterium]
FFGLFDAINERIYQNFLIFNKKNTVSSEIVIIEIDHYSIKKLGKWPWSRSYIIDLLNKIKGYPTVIGINLSFTDSQNHKIDNKLYQTLIDISNVVILARYAEKEVGNITLKLPEKSLFPRVTHGHDLLDYSKSGTINSIQPFKKMPAFSLAVLENYYKFKGKNDTPKKLQKIFTLSRIFESEYLTKPQILIDYRRTHEQFKHISFVDILRDKVNLNQLKDKIVLIGITDKYLVSTYTTPFTGVSTKSSGSTSIELQAQIIDSFINYRGLYKCPDWLLIFISVVLTICFYLLVKNKSILNQSIIFVSSLVLLFILDYIYFLYGAFWFPPSLLAILLIITFGFSFYSTAFSIDHILNQTIDNMTTEKNIPLDDIPRELSGRVATVTKLLDVISKDRQTIKAIIDGINYGVIVINTRGKILWANEEFKNIFKNINILEKNINELMPELNFDDIQPEIFAELIFKKEIKILDTDYLCIFNLIESNKNQVIAVFNDITEFKKLDTVKTNMLKMVSHELRTPLNAILGFSQSLQLKYFGELNEKQMEYVNLINSSGKHLLDIVNNILDISKIDAGATELKIQNHDSKILFAEIISVLGSQIEEKEIILSSEISSDVPSIKCDRQKFKQIMFNILSNAIKFTPQKGNINLKAIKYNNQAIKITISDNGPGIKKELQEKIFDEFYQLEQHRDQALGGTGIGLALTKRLVGLHGGNIGVESELEKGSTFWFTLPV